MGKDIVSKKKDEKRNIPFVSKKDIAIFAIGIRIGDLSTN